MQRCELCGTRYVEVISLPNERWVDIKGYEDLYMISNMGRVLSKGRQVSRVMYGHIINQYMDTHLLAITSNGAGYLIASLNKNGKRKNHYIHRLVAEHFIPNPKNYPQVNHKDYNRNNNTVDNLEWCTAKQNINYSRVNRPKHHYTKRIAKSGHRYITMRGDKYRVIITGNGKEKTFCTLDEALTYRNQLLESRREVMEGYCELCGKKADAFHHLCFGNSNRRLSDEDGLTMKLCNSCHNMAIKPSDRIHGNIVAEKLSKMLGQAIWERNYYEKGGQDNAREQFIKRYGKSFL